MREAVILMAYGSPPTNPDDIMEYLRDIYHGHEPPEYAVKENVEKYRMAGGVSPSNRIIESVRQKLEARLAREGDFRVMLGFKHWRPSIESAVREARDWGGPGS
ncbi:ferrochelatase [Thermogymnomonas acidicola]|uniref:ferrochelatase n=1 Tax=Thermogymnomonas acidicola TaxID=399579 RepID=UPI00094645C8|nr:ferrochelatase [Thermogymnomonas acidicola]